MNPNRHDLNIDLRNLSRDTARALADLLRKDSIATDKLLKRAKRNGDQPAVHSLDRTAYQVVCNLAQVELYLSGN